MIIEIKIMCFMILLVIVLSAVAALLAVGLGIMKIVELLEDIIKN